MNTMVSILRLGSNPRLEQALLQLNMATVSTDSDLSGRRILFAVSVDEGGPDPAFYAFLRRLRTERDCMAGSAACVVVDGTTEEHTKAAAQELVLAANRAGCRFPGRPLIEATGSLYNQHIQARNLGLSWQETYFHRVRELVDRLANYEPPRFRRPKVLLLHASDQKRSNTLALGRAVCDRLADCCDIREVQLLNGTVQDCRGCGYQACLHFAEHDSCFYGGMVSEEVLPAIREADVLLFLCPNYNDALSANLTALINRMTGLVLKQDMGGKYLAAVVVSGYSGGDLVARQLLGAMSMNRGCALPPDFCLLQTAHDPGDALKAFGVDALVERFANRLKSELLDEYSQK